VPCARPGRVDRRRRKHHRQYLAAGSLDELYLHIVPVLLGSGERLLEDVGDPKLEPINVVASPAVTHVKYRIDKRVS
jgi:dihydrofolate reductase